MVVGKAYYGEHLNPDVCEYRSAPVQTGRTRSEVGVIAGYYGADCAVFIFDTTDYAGRCINMLATP
jgi:hypothetical protein